MKKDDKKPEATENTITMRFTAGVLKKAMVAVMPCISKEETRYYLNGVHFENNPAAKNEVILVATNGHTMAINEVENALEAETKKPVDLPKVDFILERDACKYLANIKARTSPSRRGNMLMGSHYDPMHVVQIEITGFNVKIINEVWGKVEEIQFFKLIDGTFPDWKRVLPISPAFPFTQFNARYLAEIATAVYRFSDNTQAMALQQSVGSADPCYVLTGNKKLKYIVMPMRGGIQPVNTSTLKNEVFLIVDRMKKLEVKKHPKLYGDAMAALNKLLEALGEN